MTTDANNTTRRMLPVWFYAASSKAQSCATPLVERRVVRLPQPLKGNPSRRSFIWEGENRKVIERLGICGFEPLLWGN
jgi:hypothetical protein